MKAFASPIGMPSTFERLKAKGERLKKVEGRGVEGRGPEGGATISNQQSAISNQQSAISNQQSAISNQQPEGGTAGREVSAVQLRVCEPDHGSSHQRE